MITFTDTYKLFKYPENKTVNDIDIIVWSSITKNIYFLNNDYDGELVKPSDIGFTYVVYLFHPDKLRHPDRFQCQLIDPICYINNIIQNKYSGIILKIKYVGVFPKIENWDTIEEMLCGKKKKIDVKR